MLFNSFNFLLFFPTVTAIYFLLPHRFRWIFLLAASCFFYMAFIPVYILVLFTTIIIDYIAAIFIEESQGQKRKIFLIISILSTCLVLFIFKYFNFFNANLGHLAHLLHWNYSIKRLSLLLPIGLSFHTFQSLSYVIEVYRGNQKAERHFGIYALYVMFFPQLTAGPIERPQNLLHQFYEKHHFDYERVTDGLKLILWGLFKKAVIADRLAILVNTVYDDPSKFPPIAQLLATVFFAFQVYCDFSGYSDIAIGCAQVLGFKLMDNFNRPYSSRSISEFWQRWHISLSSWLRDYLFYPLFGSGFSNQKLYLNVMITFIVCGLWHGAGWTYILWGALHGFYIVFGMATKGIRKQIVHTIGLSKFPRIHHIFQTVITFSLVCFTYIFFRSVDFTEARMIVKSMGIIILQIFTLNFQFIKDLVGHIGDWGLSPFELWIAFGAVAFMEYVHLIQRHGSIRHMLRQKPIWLRWAIYFILIFAIIVVGEFNQLKFIYFQF
jgi:alginate O-acetyltransferase complex protein AlgI